MMACGMQCTVEEQASLLGDCKINVLHPSAHKKQQPFSAARDQQHSHGWPHGPSAGASYGRSSHSGLRQHEPVSVELYKLAKLAVPLLLQYVIANSSHLINTSFVGHLHGPALLSCMVLATSLSMATGYSIISGIASASETLCGQACGARNYRSMHCTLQRALLMAALACVPITVIWMHAEGLLVALGQPAPIAAGAARYLQLTLPALYLYAIHECVDKYLLSQRVVQPSLVITAATTALTPLFAWWFVVNQDLGLDGAAYAYVAVQACTTSLGLAYLAYREKVLLPGAPPEGWVPLRFSGNALRNWGPYVALAVPAVMSYCMEGWATEVLIFMSGLLPNADVAVGVTGLALQFSTLVWLAAASIGSATSTRVANKLGGGDGMGARRCARTAMLVALIAQALLGAASFFFSSSLMQLMTNDTQVIEVALQVMPVLACCFVADGLNVVLGAVLQGAGRQWWTAQLNVAGWWCVGVPLAYYLAVVRGCGPVGLWAGFATASALQAALQGVAVNMFLDWDIEVARAQQRIAEGEGADGEEQAEACYAPAGSQSPAPAPAAAAVSTLKFIETAFKKASLGYDDDDLAADVEAPFAGELDDGFGDVGSGGWKLLAGRASNTISGSSACCSSNMPPVGASCDLISMQSLVSTACLDSSSSMLSTNCSGETFSSAGHAGAGGLCSRRSSIDWDSASVHDAGGSGADSEGDVEEGEAAGSASTPLLVKKVTPSTPPRRLSCLHFAWNSSALQPIMHRFEVERAGSM